MTDAVLQHGDARPWAAELLQPWRAGWRVVRLGAQQNPVARLCSVGIGQGANWNLDRAFRALDDEPLDGASETGDDIVSNPAMTPPMLPRPMTATRVRCGP